MKQIPLFKKQNLSYGGELLNTRKGRAHGRPLDTRNSMHLVLRSSKAKGGFSFMKHNNCASIKRIINQFAQKYAVQILSIGNAGNHLHIHLRLTKRASYKPFIRAITGAIAMAVTGASRWSPSKLDGKFWDYRPFTRVVVGVSAFRHLKTYIEVNQWEGLGVDRITAYLKAAREGDRVLPARWQ